MRRYESESRVDLRAMLFYLTIAFLFAHEVDAVLRAEWRLLYVLRDLPESAAAEWFVALHVPLFAAILWLAQHRNPKVQVRSKLAIAVFAIVHAGLHFRLRNDPISDFSSPLSLALIHGSALCGLLLLVLLRASVRHGRGEISDQILRRRL